MKILITGCKGQLGSEIIHILQNETCELETISQEYEHAKIIGADSKKLDITNLGLVREYIDKVRPDIVINSAAYTNVEAVSYKHMTLPTIYSV